MKTERFTIKNIPVLLIGEPSRKVYLYVHGKQGSKEEALDFAERACPRGYQVLAIDLPEHGARKNSPEKLLPEVVIPELQLVYQYAVVHWRSVSLRATSIGAWFSMLALAEKPLRKALFVSPIVDREALHSDWRTPTQVLYGTADNMTARELIDQFKSETGAHLTFLEGGEHWFHTEIQLAALLAWEEHNL